MVFFKGFILVDVLMKDFPWIIQECFVKVNVEGSTKDKLWYEVIPMKAVSSKLFIMWSWGWDNGVCNIKVCFWLRFALFEVIFMEIVIFFFEIDMAHMGMGDWSYQVVIMLWEIIDVYGWLE